MILPLCFISLSIAGIPFVTLSFSQENVDIIIPEMAKYSCRDNTEECFIPNEVTINVGTQVTWHNHDSSGHTVQPYVLQEDILESYFSDIFMPGQSYSHVFQKEGHHVYQDI